MAYSGFNDLFFSMRLLYISLVAGVALVFYLSWIPNPQLGALWFIPDWLARWTDAHANEDLRTGVPFVFLGLCAGFWPSKKPRSLTGWLAAWELLVGVVIIAEAGQLLLPNRSFSWSDVGWGAAGAFVGLTVAVILIGIRRRLRA
jgi:hypothetical protein